MYRSLLLACLTLPGSLIAQERAPSPPAGLASVWSGGAMRHVQLLAPAEDGALRFATSLNRARGKPTWKSMQWGMIALHVGEQASHVADLHLPGPAVPLYSYRSRPTWHLFELGDSAQLASQDPQGGGLTLQAFPDGAVLQSIPESKQFLDGWTHEGRGEVLACNDQTLYWLRLDADGNCAEPAEFETGLDRVVAGCLERGQGTKAPDAWLLGWKGDSLALRRFHATGEVDDPQRVSAKVLPKSNLLLRLAAWREGGGTRLAIGDPEFDHAVGRVLLLHATEGLELTYDGCPEPTIIGDTYNQGHFGQCVAFVPDRTGDGVADLLVTAPDAHLSMSGYLSCLDGATGARAWRWQSGVKSWQWGGFSLSLSGDYSQVLLGGAIEIGEPEDLSKSGKAYLVDLETQKTIRSWALSGETGR